MTANCKVIRVEDAKQGMELADIVVDENDKIILCEGTVLTDNLLNKLKSWGISRVSINPRLDVVDTPRSLQQKIFNDYADTVMELKESFRTIRYFKEVPIDQMRELSKTHIDPLVDAAGIINHLHMVRRADDYTFHHSINVAVICGVLGKWLGYMGEDLRNLIMAGLVHDVGKTQIPLEVLNKPGKLTADEMLIMKQHTTLGFELISKSPTLPRSIILGAIQHHERMNGSGYPFQLSGDSIHPFARIIAVADIYDAMTSNRVYQKRVTPFEVVDIMVTERFDKLDPKICTVFLNNIRDYFLGNIVKLNDGREAEVVYVGQYVASRPTIRTGGGEFIDLEKSKDLSIVQLVKT